MVRERLRHGLPGLPLLPLLFLPLVDILIGGVGAEASARGDDLLAIILIITFIAIPVPGPAPGRGGGGRRGRHVPFRRLDDGSASR